MPTPESIAILQGWLGSKPRFRRKAIGVDMPEFRLYRRRESVTADEVIAKMRSAEIPEGYAATVVQTAIAMIEVTITEICRKGPNAERR